MTARTAASHCASRERPPWPNHDGDKSEPRVHRLRFEGQYREHALMDSIQGLTTNEALERFDAQRELAGSERALAAQAARAQARELGWRVVLRAIDDPQVLAPADLDARLDE